MAKSKTPPQETIFFSLTGTECGSQPSLTTRDRELVSVLEVRIEPRDMNPRSLTSQSVKVEKKNVNIFNRIVTFLASPPG